ncbi:TIGR00266 family protein [Sphingomonas sp. IBVSS2]|nr:TIGR00266 family protein [Sphingomonas sp. IBVSS2]
MSKGPHPSCDVQWLAPAGAAKAAPNRLESLIMPQSPWSHSRSAGVADDIDFEIKGQELQFVEIELDPGESAVAEAGALVWKDAAVGMTTVFGDGSGAQGGGFMGALLGAGKRLVTGESLFTTVFTHNGSGKARVAFAAPVPGAIVPLKLDSVGGTLICQKDAFLCAAKGVSMGIAFQRRIMTGLFGGEGFIMQKLDGDGWVFVQFGGMVVERELAAGEELHVDTGCVAAFTPSVEFDLVGAGGVRSAIFGGEGLFFARLRGPGKVWIQSLPFSRLAGRMMAAASSHGGQNRGEGSVLGGLGDLIGGNR